ncbi:MAG: HIRAN domain-containing protein [Nitriliruptoraceae bacterium]
MATETFRTPVRGYPFAAAPPGIAAPGRGQVASLVREPANPADPHAIAVWVEPSDAVPWRIGYLDRFVASRLAPLLDSGQQLSAAIDGWIHEPDERWQRPLLRISAPAQSTGRQRSQDGQDAAGAEDEDAVAPGLWGRPPGVRWRSVAA